MSSPQATITIPTQQVACSSPAAPRFPTRLYEVSATSYLTSSLAYTSGTSGDVISEQAPPNLDQDL